MHVHRSALPHQANAQWHDMMVSHGSTRTQAGTAHWQKARVPTVEYIRNPAFANDTTAQLSAHCAELKAGQCRDAAQIAEASSTLRTQGLNALGVVVQCLICHRHGKHTAVQAPGFGAQGGGPGKGGGQGGRREVCG